MVKGKIFHYECFLLVYRVAFFLGSLPLLSTSHGVIEIMFRDFITECIIIYVYIAVIKLN